MINMLNNNINYFEKITISMKNINYMCNIYS